MPTHPGYAGPWLLESANAHTISVTFVCGSFLELNIWHDTVEFVRISRFYQLDWC